MVAGRPRKEIDEEKLKQLAEAQCTNEQIADALGVSHDTIERGYACVLRASKAKGLCDLKLAQWHKGVKNLESAMLRHLGKHYLGQHDQLQVNSNNETEVRRILNMWQGNTPPLSKLLPNVDA